MPSLSFSKEFAEAVERGEKRQTIRQPRKRPIRPGDALYLFTGMRTAHCRRLGIGCCTTAKAILLGTGPLGDEIELSGRRLGVAARAKLARADGFSCASEMLAWFAARYGLPFEGVLVQWEGIRD